MNSVILSYIVKKLNEELTNKRFKKIKTYANAYIITWDSGKHKKKQIIHESYTYLTKKEFETEEDNLCRIIKSHLKNSKLLGINQINNDRIIALEFQHNNLIIELFGKGNIILTNENNKIIDAYIKRKWRHRAIVPGEGYVPPPKSKIDINVISFDEFKHIWSQNPKQLNYPPEYINWLFNNIKSTDKVWELIKSETNTLFECDSKIYPWNTGSCKKIADIMDYLDKTHEIRIQQKENKREDKIKAIINEYREKAREYRAIANYILNNTTEIKKKIDNKEVKYLSKNKVKLEIPLIYNDNVTSSSDGIVVNDT